MESASPPAHTAASSEVITGHVSRWYFRRRMGPLIAILLFMGLYFIYDGKVGYPKANAIVDQKEWLEMQVTKTYLEAKSQGPVALEAWRARASAEAWPVGPNGEPLPWVSWAAARNLPETPRRWTQAEITQQFWFGGACILASFIATLVMLSNRGKTVSAGADYWVTAKGQKIPFASITRLDVRKWPRKGLAYAWYRDSENGPVHKAVLDDFKFTKMQPILDRLRANLKGELIENDAVETAAEANDRETIR